MKEINFKWRRSFFLLEYKEFGNQEDFVVFLNYENIKFVNYMRFGFVCNFVHQHVRRYEKERKFTSID